MSINLFMGHGMEKEFTPSEINKLKTLILLSMASFIFFMYVGFIGGIGLWESVRPSEEQNSEVQGVSTSTTISNDFIAETDLPDDTTITNVNTDSSVQIALNNTTPGEGVVELHLNTPMQITDARLEFKIEGDLVIKDIECSRAFECIQISYNEESIALYVVAANSESPKYVQGKVMVATIYYDSSTSAELVLNSEEPKSGVARVGGSNNLISQEIQYLAIGRKDF